MHDKNGYLDFFILITPVLENITVLWTFIKWEVNRNILFIIHSCTSTTKKPKLTKNTVNSEQSDFVHIVNYFVPSDSEMLLNSRIRESSMKKLGVKVQYQQSDFKSQVKDKRQRQQNLLIILILTICLVNSVYNIQRTVIDNEVNF